MDILNEKTSTEDEKLVEGIVSSLLGGAKDILSNLISKGGIKNVDRVVVVLRRLKKLGIKHVGGESINKAIRELVQYKQKLTDEMTDDEDKDELSLLLHGLIKDKLGQETPQRRQAPRTRAEGKYSLSAIFSENKGNVSYMVENEPDKEYHLDDLVSPDDDETIMGNAADNDPELSADEVLSGLRDDVAQYGDPDPVLDE